MFLPLFRLHAVLIKRAFQDVSPEELQQLEVVLKKIGKHAESLATDISNVALLKRPGARGDEPGRFRDAYKQMAAELGASEATVKMHRSQVMKKMQANSLPELARMADKLKSIT